MASIEVTTTTTLAPEAEANLTSTVTSTSTSVRLGPEEAFPVPDYVCCVVTEAVWTWFAATLLIVVLFAVATLKYCKKRMNKPKFEKKNQNLLLRHVLADDKGII